MEREKRAEVRKLPQVARLIEAVGDIGSKALVADAAKEAVAEARKKVMEGEPAPSIENLAARATEIFERRKRGRLMPLINATGVILHTNLGRAPLSPRAARAVASIITGYSNLEYDISSASRGSRYERPVDLLTTLTGAEAALVVNNNAAAVLLALASLARGREVVISRGELIEIGGGFRIPEILAESGAVLREVGTTNRTHLSDYEKAIGERTAAILKVHPSNYRVVGFASSVEAADLARLAHTRGLVLIHDIGSGLLTARVGGEESSWLSSEPSVREALEDADVVAFSGDKLLGGPQAGVILGREHAVSQMRRSPLLRAFRVDKMTLAALEATLLDYLEGRETEIPVWSMALASLPEIEERARDLAARLEPIKGKVEVADGYSTTGGGSLPGGSIPTILVEIAPRDRSAAELFRALVGWDPPIVSRVENDKVVIDLRTVDPAHDMVLADAVLRSCT